MTDHLDAARAALCTDHGETLDLLDCARALGHLIDHLEAQQTPQQPTTAPQTAQQTEPGHRDGDEAVQAVARVLHPEMYRPNYQPFVCFAETRTMGELLAADRARAEAKARAAIAAAEPHIRAKIAAEIEAMDLSDQYGPLTAHGARADAARIARQEQS